MTPREEFNAACRRAGLDPDKVGFIDPLTMELAEDPDRPLSLREEQLRDEARIERGERMAERRDRFLNPQDYGGE